VSPSFLKWLSTKKRVAASWALKIPPRCALSALSFSEDVLSRGRTTRFSLTFALRQLRAVPKVRSAYPSSTASSAFDGWFAATERAAFVLRCDLVP
jgi:hypothetical protein